MTHRFKELYDQGGQLQETGAEEPGGRDTYVKVILTKFCADRERRIRGSC